MLHTSFRARLVLVLDVEEARTILTEPLILGRRDELLGGDDSFNHDLARLLFPVKIRRGTLTEPEMGGLSPASLGKFFAEAEWEMCLETQLRLGSRSLLGKTVLPSTVGLTERERKAVLRSGGN